MTVAQMHLPATLPLDPHSVLAADWTPGERGEFYKELNLGPLERYCVEEAMRLIVAGAYPETAR
jgi:hypothetical protein